LGTAFEPNADLLATRSMHKLDHLFIHVLRVKDAPPSYVEVVIYKLVTDFLSMGWREINGVIDEIEPVNPGFPSTSDPTDNSLWRMPPDHPTFNCPRATVNAI
jgi:hypothetical protein